MNDSTPTLARALLLKNGRLALAVITVLLLSGSAKELYAQEIPAHRVARLMTAPANGAKPRVRRGEILDVPAEGESFPSSFPAKEDANAIERIAFDRTNEQRVHEGLAPLGWDPALCVMARQHSEEMARLGYFSHESPSGLRLKDRARQVGIIRFRLIAENIAYNQGFDDPGALAVERWMLSPGHRENILSGDFQDSAVGSFVSRDGSVFLTQVFIQR
ncbi:MAG TPA: CAP domain-containing protein [Pyrinomonadaceae bacterium]|nr:CAP domain-containing protein [Pyrinomonadaceae bacterium]